MPDEIIINVTQNVIYIETTLDRYGHVNEDMKRDAAKKRSEILKEI